MFCGFTICICAWEIAYLSIVSMTNGSAAAAVSSKVCLLFVIYGSGLCILWLHFLCSLFNVCKVLWPLCRLTSIIYWVTDTIATVLNFSWYQTFCSYYDAATPVSHSSHWGCSIIVWSKRLVPRKRKQCILNPKKELFLCIPLRIMCR